MDRHDNVGRQLVRRLLLLGSLEKRYSWPSVAVAAVVMGLVSWITVSLVSIQPVPGSRGLIQHQLRLAKRVQRHRRPPPPPPDTSAEPSKPRPIEPLDDFQWQDVEPRKLRPWKPVYHITMGELALTYTNPTNSPSLIAKTSSHV
jgi:hypothetical protein